MKSWESQPPPLPADQLIEKFAVQLMTKGQDLATFFKEADSDNDGVLSVDELVAALHNLLGHMTISPVNYWAFGEILDTNKNNKVEAAEFQAIFEKPNEQKEPVPLSADELISQVKTALQSEGISAETVF